MAQRIEIIIDGDNVKAVNAISGVETKLKGLDKKAKGSGGILDQVFNTFFGSLERTVATGIAGAVAGLGIMIKSAIDAGDKLHDMSMKTGIAVETLSLLDYAAKLNSTDIDSVSNLIVKFNKNIYEAADGTGEATNNFKRMGISLNDTNGKLKDSETLLFEVTKKFKDMPDGVEKTAVAMKLFGKSGAESIAMLNDLGKNGEEYKKFLKDTGALITTEFAAAADRFNDSLTTMKTALSGIGIKLAEDFLPSLTATSIAFVQIASDSSNSISIISLLGDVIKVIATALGGVAVGALIAAEGLGTYYAVVAKLIMLRPGEAWIALNIGLKQIKTTALDVGKIFDAMWNPDKFKGQIDALNAMNKANTLLDSQNAEVKKLSDSWKEIGALLRYENMVAGLDPQSKKLEDLIHKANQLKEKYYAIPGAIDLINYNLQKMIDIQFNPKVPMLDNIIPKEMKPELQLKPMLDPSGILTGAEIIKASLEDISFSSQLNFGIMQGYAQDAAANMDNAFMMFYEATGERNRTLFDISKGFAIANAIINTYEGATKAIAQGGIWGAISAIGIIASGLGYVAKIASTQPTSRSVSGGSSTGYSSSSAAQSSLSSGSTTNNNNQRNVTVTVNVNSQVLAGDSLDKWLRDNLSGSINKAVKDGVINFG